MGEIVKQEEAPVALTLKWDEIKKNLAPGFTDQEWFIAMGKCKAMNLNPLKGECHFVKYKDDSPGQVIVEYKEFLKVAETTGMLDGWNIVFDRDDNPTKATITIHRKDRKHPFVWPVYRQEFDKQRSTWKVMPRFMLMKVAIAQGFRLAFPLEMGNMPYIQEEIEHISDNNVGSVQNLPIEESEPRDEPLEPIEVGEQLKEDALFDEVVSKCGADPGKEEDEEAIVLYSEYLKHLQDKSNATRIQILERANSNIDGFYKNFKKWIDGE